MLVFTKTVCNRNKSFSRIFVECFPAPKSFPLKKKTKNLSCMTKAFGFGSIDSAQWYCTLIVRLIVLFSSNPYVLSHSFPLHLSQAYQQNLLPKMKLGKFVDNDQNVVLSRVTLSLFTSDFQIFFYCIQARLSSDSKFIQSSFGEW